MQISIIIAKFAPIRQVLEPPQGCVLRYSPGRASRSLVLEVRQAPAYAGRDRFRIDAYRTYLCGDRVV